MLLGEIGLNAVEARVMLAPEIDGLDGCFFADWAFKLVGHITDICNTKYCRIIFIIIVEILNMNMETSALYKQHLQKLYNQNTVVEDSELTSFAYLKTLVLVC